jgi:hypothetical protein
VVRSEEGLHMQYHCQTCRKLGTNVTVLLISHDSVFFDGVGSPFEALPRFGISRDQNAYKCERGCLTFHTMPYHLLVTAHHFVIFVYGAQFCTNSLATSAL